MIGNRQRGLEDYVAIGRRQLKVFLVPVLLAPLLGFLISFALSPKYTSHSLLQVEGQVVPAGYVKPIVTERVSDRMTTMEQNVLSRERLRPLVNRLGLVRAGNTEDDAIEDVRRNLSVTEADPNFKPFGRNLSAPQARAGTADVSGFFVTFTSNNPGEAQRICAEITAMLLGENLNLREQVAQTTTDFISVQLDQAKRGLDDLDKKLSNFEKAHVGRLPGDSVSNLQILAGLQSQLDANSQAQSRAQQDKSYAESLLAQELAAWKTNLATPALPALQQQLISLQNHLAALQARSTDHHPEVMKTKREIAELTDKLKQMNSDTDDSPAPGNLKKLEPQEIRALRQQIHRVDENIEHSVMEQDRLRQQIELYQTRLAISPEVEEQYKSLTRDNATAHSIYDNLLANKNSAEMQATMERKQQGEQLRLIDPASLPGSPSFPVRWMFAAYGLGAGLCIGLAIALWRELQDRSMRDEADVMAALGLPMLASVSSVAGSESNKAGKNKTARLTPLFDGE